ncbi:hypothetical protein Ctha_2125 [Chloroherpeton thalassium ATCC 35110]|uniref:DUF697 domain-containing protein n=1 Tax=Chloroherpeton thalassium (strain ATCC 35110 / GB-78) TaxID=517418 RepID=B3QVH7_CHLT3|nr:hypothetical protein [Chloroherpeton thalassium]ACF14577.1 hypothetical protein Ctha_2125 [Chloroherpeton thalassium ATCC 35110]
MKNIFHRLILSFGAFFIGTILFFFVFNQTVTFYQFFRDNYPLFEKFVFFSILGFYSVSFFALLLLFIFSSKTFIPPHAGDEVDIAKYVKKLSKHLEKNPLLFEKRSEIQTRADLDTAITQLNQEATLAIQTSASSCFIGTAIALNGKMDTSFVTITLMKMLWRIVHIYFPSPSLFQLYYLYKKIFISAIVITEIEEEDIPIQVSPIVKSMFASGISGTIPGINIVATLLTNSILDGTVNAFFILRIGVVCKILCGSLSQQSMKDVLSRANHEAAELLYDVVKESSSVVSDAIKASASQTSSRIFTETSNSDPRSSTNTAKDIFSTVAKSIGSMILEKRAEKRKKRYSEHEDPES